MWIDSEDEHDCDWRQQGEPFAERQILHGGFLSTVTVENLGSAAAEVGITVRLEHGDARQRLIVKAHEKASARVEVATLPLEITVNDGSVPESDTSNNSYTVPPQQ